MVITPAQAGSLVTDGATLAIGGMTLYRRPVTLVREILRRRPRGLTLFALTGGFEADLLVGAGCVETVRTCYFGLEIFGLAPMFTALASTLRIIEETESTVCGAFRGTVPIRALEGTDILKVRPDIRAERSFVHYPPVRIDVALLHALEADRDGNARFLGNLACDLELAGAADRVVVSAERIVDRVEEPTIRAHDVVEAPRGAWPTSCYPDYTFDGLEILRYVRACKAGGFGGYLAEFVGAK